MNEAFVNAILAFMQICSHSACPKQIMKAKTSHFQ